MRIRLVAALGPRDSSIPAFLALSVVAHVLFAVAVLWLASSARSTSGIEPSIHVVLLDGSDLPRGGPPNRAAAAQPDAIEPDPAEEIPEQADPEGVSAAQEPEEIVPPKPKKEPEKKPEKKPEKLPVLTKPQAPSSKAPSDNSGVPGNPEAGSGGSGPGSTGDGPGRVEGFEGIDSQFDWYSRQVQSALYREWTQPPLSTTLREPVSVTVQFEIMRNGSITSVKLISSSGIAVMDRSVLRAMANATLPPLPPAMRVERRAVTVNFTLNPDET